MTEVDTLADMTVTALLQRWPQAAWVFQERQMACVGCAVADYYSVADAARVYRQDLAAFLADLQQVTADSRPADGMASGQDG